MTVGSAASFVVAVGLTAPPCAAGVMPALSAVVAEAEVKTLLENV